MTLPTEITTQPWLNQFLGAIAVMIAMACGKYLRDIRNSVRVYKDEHDILWEDFNIRHNLPWRRHMGRGRSTVAKANGAAGAH